LEKTNPCLTCGACCAFYRASFYWAEADDETPGGVPAHLTRKLNDFRRAMIGMEGSKPRCIALEGLVGEGVRCTIYGNRPSVCRDLDASWAGGKPNERCDKARAAWGLPPLSPDAWDSPGGRPKAA
jgi:uncharacterized protein